MIAPMDQVTIVGRRKVAQEVLISLQSLGLVHIDPLEPGEESPLEPLRLKGADREEKEGWDAAVSRSASLLNLLGAAAASPVSRSEVPAGLAEIAAQLETIGSQVDRLVAERGEIADELDVIATFLPLFRELAPNLAQLESSRYLRGCAFAVPADDYEEVATALAEALEGRLLLVPRDQGRQYLVIAATLREDHDPLRTALGRAGLSELILPERYEGQGVAKAVHIMEVRSQTLPRRRVAIEEELRQLAEEQAGRLKAMHQVASNHQSRYQRLEELAEGRYGFALRGWVPVGERARVVDSLQRQFGDDLVVETRAADEHHDRDIPVKLDNPGWVKPFEGLLALFAPPKYGSFDPSWTLALFFPFFFGIVVGDIGFGLMFASVAWLLRRRGAVGKALSLGPINITIPAKVLAPISTVIFWCSAWSVLFGFGFGEFFGNLLERFPAGRPVFYTSLHHPAGHGLIDIPLFRVEVFTPLLLVSLGFGILQVLGGWAIRVIYGFRHHDMKHVYEGVGMFSGLLALVIFATAFLTGTGGPVVTGLVIAGLAVFVIATVLARIPLMLLEIFSNSGHILSYLRLFAVGLSAALVANLATDLGFAVGGTLPIIGPILGILIGLLVHLIAIALTIIGHTLQPLRLHYVEFFTKFGFYDESGRPYRPFRLLGGKS